VPCDWVKLSATAYLDGWAPRTRCQPHVDIKTRQGMATASSSSPSIVSIDPAVAHQITVGTGDNLADAFRARHGKSGSTEKHIHTEKRPGKRPSRNETHGADGAAASQERMGRTRPNSLRHVKNSKELLRQRSIKRNVIRGIDAQASSKEGRNFTVGNVGTGGLIYLR
jgi:hypothetical protein